jgi:hypothetical protein
MEDGGGPDQAEDDGIQGNTSDGAADASIVPCP